MVSGLWSWAFGLGPWAFGLGPLVLALFDLGGRVGSDYQRSKTKHQRQKAKDEYQCPLVINNPISSSVATFGSTSPTIRPSWITSNRSDKEVTSSSSAHTSNTA